MKSSNFSRTLLGEVVGKTPFAADKTTTGMNDKTTTGMNERKKDR